MRSLNLYVLYIIISIVDTNLYDVKNNENKITIMAMSIVIV